jgi:TetR/AcrR family transcriptional regulator
MVDTLERAPRPASEASREAILAAAVDLFSDRSFDGATMREIAKRAGVTQPLLNYHYTSKDELWRAAIDSLFVLLDVAMAERLVERHVRPLYTATVDLFERLGRAGIVPPIPAPHLYYILTGAGPTMFVLAPECRRLSGLDPSSDAVIEAHADAVCQLLFR